MQSPSPFHDEEKSRQSRRKGRRESYTRFSPSEQQNLLDGVARYGAGNWKKILSSYTFHSKRTAVDLKDKYRNILRAQERARNASMRPASSHIPNSNSRHEHSNPAPDMRGTTSSTSRRHGPEYSYGFRNMSDVPAPAEPPVSSSYRPRHGPAAATPYQRNVPYFPPIPNNLAPRSHSSRRTPAQPSGGSGSLKSRSSSSLPVAALLTAPDVHY